MAHWALWPLGDEHDLLVVDEGDAPGGVARAAGPGGAMISVGGERLEQPRTSPRAAPQAALGPKRHDLGPGEGPSALAGGVQDQPLVGGHIEQITPSVLLQSEAGDLRAAGDLSPQQPGAGPTVAEGPAPEHGPPGGDDGLGGAIVDQVPRRPLGEPIDGGEDLTPGIFAPGEAAGLAVL